MKRIDVIKRLLLSPFAMPALTLTDLIWTRQDGRGQPSLHDRAFVMDGHIHTITRQLLEQLDFGDRYPDGHVDLPRIKAGGLNALFFSVYTPEPYYIGRHEVKNTFRVIELAREQIEKNKAHIELALTASDIEAINRKGKIAAFLDLEGGYDLDGDIHLLCALYRMGLRSMQLTAHNASNAFIDSCYGARLWGGINAHGRKIVSEMNRLGMLVNVAHASDEAIIQVAEVSEHPVIYSHGGFRSIVANLRCITDEAASAVTRKGGVIGIQFGGSFNNPRFAEWRKRTAGQGRPDPGTVPVPVAQSIYDVDRQLRKSLPFVYKGEIPDNYQMDVDQLANVIDYGVQRFGDDHIALGSDFDGGPPLPRQIRDVSDYPQITAALMRRGYGEDRIRKIIGLNWLRVIREVTET